jgi:hypothetical protein
VARRDRMDTLLDASSRSRYYPQLAAASADEAMVARIEAFAAAHVEASSRRPAKDAMTQVQERVALVRDRLPDVDRWLANANDRR